MNANTLEYIPQAPAQPASDVKYALVEDVSGKPSTKELTFPDGSVSFKVHKSPNKKCKKCHGRGFVGKNSIANTLILCHKCYPRL